MARHTIINLAAEHNISCEMREGRVWLLGVSTLDDGQMYGEWVDATDWDRRELLAWLGY